MENALLSTAYIVASVLFILSLRGLSSQETARRGNLYGIAGMALAVLATLLRDDMDGYAWLAMALAGGTAIGGFLAARVAMTAMPELVALLHSFVGAAAVLVGLSLYVDPTPDHVKGGILLTEIGLDIFIGALTFTGSVLAFLKLRGSVSGKPTLLPGRHLLNLAVTLVSVALVVLVVGEPAPGQVGVDEAALAGSSGLTYLLVLTALSGALGWHLVAAIGGADMPVVVSMLNSYSGWTAAAAGFMLSNDLLIVTGALVGSSGAILSTIMCRAMNRSIWSVIFGGFGSDAGAAAPNKPSSDEGAPGEVQEIDASALAGELAGARDVLIVPGYGMAVARAQHAVRELVELLRGKGATVRFGIHPVAGRLPGHMNVLLAEANVPYDIVFEMEEVNDDCPRVDVALVIGANDIVNPSAQTDTSSPIYGMPVLEVWQGRRTVVFKRSRRAGYAGVDNPLFYHERTRMLFGDAKDSVEALARALKDG